MKRNAKEKETGIGPERNLTGLVSSRPGQDKTKTKQNRSFPTKKEKLPVDTIQDRERRGQQGRAGSALRMEASKAVFPYFLTLSLVLVAGSSIYMSVYGLMAVFSDHSEIILCSGLGMEIGKILIVSHLYRNWSGLRWVPKLLFAGIVFVLAFLTSIEIMGFLSQSHIHASKELRIAEAELNSLAKEAEIIKDQIDVIDETLAGLPKTYVTRRIQERKKWGYQEKQGRLLEIENQEALLRIKIIKERQSAGPVFAVAKIMKIEDEHAIAGLILLLVMILEPLSIGLTVATTAAWSGSKPPHEKVRRDHLANQELLDFAKAYNLTVTQIAKITNRKRLRTCQEWLNGKSPVPERALRALRDWANKEGEA